jgi:hypothetical protein
MKTPLTGSAAEAALEEWRGVHAQLWQFDPSLRRLVLRLSRPREDPSAFLVAVGCRYIQGPVDWSDAELELLESTRSSRGAGGDATTRVDVVDRRAGFELRCSDAIVVVSPMAEFALT